MFWSLHGGDRKLLLTHAGAPPDRAAVEALAFLPVPGVKIAKVLLSCGGEPPLLRLQSSYLHTL